MDLSKEKLQARFEATVGGDYDAFYAMQLYHNTKNEGDEYPNFSNRFLGKPLFWQDIMEGLYDTHLFKKPMSGHYEKCAEKFESYRQDDWSYLYDFAYKVFDYLAVKTKIAENLVPAYKANDRETLAEISRVLLPKLKEKAVAVHQAHKKTWFQSYKAFGWSNMDVRYAGVVARCETAQLLIEEYLSGKIEIIESLEEERLYKGLNGFVHYSSISSPNLKT